jgi:signal transduction histidine kinase
LPAECMVRGDWGLLTTALRNVLDNACKYRHPETSPIDVRLACDEAGLITVTIGNDINPEVSLHRDELFERFTRGGTRGGRSGMGLGLYLVQRILHDHQGYAEIADTPANRFEIRLRLPKTPS